MPTKKLSSLSIFMPAYNEEKNIASTIKDAISVAKTVADKFEVIVVNDGSSDNTAQKVKQLQKTYKNIRLITHKQNKGYGGAVKTGIRNCRYDWIFFTDSDGQFRFNELRKFINERDKADIIIGYRKKRMDPFHRVFIAQVLLKLWNMIFFNLRVKDVDCAYKLFPKKVADAIDLKTESAITVTEFLVRAKRQGFTIHQMPVTHYPREHGTQTGGNIKVILKALKESILLFIELNKKQ